MAISAQDVNKLRKMTSAGMMDCKKALTEAEGDFDKAIEFFPQNAQAYNNRAWSLYKIGDPKKGLADAEKAVELKKDSAAAWDTLGTIYEALGQRDKAVEAYQTAIKVDPKQQTSRQHLVRLGVIGR